MYKQIFGCDRCGHTQDTVDQMWSIRIVVSHGHTVSSSSVAGRNQVLWCRKCCDEFQMINQPSPTPTVPEPKVLTFEERLMSVLSDMVEEAVMDRVDHLRRNN